MNATVIEASSIDGQGDEGVVGVVLVAAAKEFSPPLPLTS
jgi:hypothetical protein